MAEREEDFFKSALGSQAAVMNAWILWKKDLEFTSDDIVAAIPEIKLSAVKGHLDRLAGDHPTRGGFLVRVAPGVYRINTEKLG